MGDVVTCWPASGDWDSTKKGELTEDWSDGLVGVGVDWEGGDVGREGTCGGF